MLVKVEVEPEEERVQEGINTKNKQQSGGIFEDLMKTLSKQEKQRNLVQ